MNTIEHISHPLIHALAWSLIHSLWQILLIVLLWRIALIIASKSSAQFRYRMSLLAFFALPASFVYTFIRQWNIYNSARQVVSIEFEPGVFMPASGEHGLFFLERGQPSFLTGLESYSPVIFWLYITGMLAAAILSIFSYQKISRLKRNSSPLPSEWQQSVLKVLQRTGLSGSVPIRASAATTIPLVVGFLKPMILLPSAMLLSMSADQVESIIMHELYHIRRLDHIVNMLQLLLEIVLFYHPAMWWISRVIRQLREESVDEWVVSQIEHPKEYAHALLQLEQSRGASMPQPMVAATQSRNHLFTRIKHMMTMKTRSLSTGHKLATTLAFILAFVTVAWVKPVIPGQTSTETSEISHAAPYATLNIDQFAPVEEAPDIPPPPPADLAMAETSSGETPNTIYLKDGTTISYEGLSEKDREKIKKAMEEVQIALKEVNEELRKELQSEEFKQEMRQARVEIQKAMEELNAIKWDSLMHEVGQAIKVGMKGFQIGMEALHEGMQELGPAMEKLMQELEKEMEQLGEEMDKKEQ